MTCRTYPTHAKTADDGRTIIDHIDQLENEEYHEYGDCPNHIMERSLSATRPGWMDVTCACGMRITIAPDVEALVAEEADDANED